MNASANANSGNPFTAGIKPPTKASAAASNNLAKAMQMQAAEEAMGVGGKATRTDGNEGAAAYPEVDQFLASINLDKYKERFLENGIEDEETILELNDAHLDAIGIPLGYKLKILKRIKMVRQEKGMTVPESRQGTR